ncbi:hypothetical protein KC346_g10040 [Hortaea werneckii]|nr:hypothetical protein KC346_g10040 [Hortaea werneckii]
MLPKATTSKMPTCSKAMVRSTGNITVQNIRKANRAVLLKGTITISLMHPTENTKDFKEHSKTNSKLQIEVHNIVSHPFTITNIHANRPETSHTVSNFEARRSTNTKCRVNVTTTLDTSNVPVEHLRKPTVIQ